MMDKVATKTDLEPVRDSISHVRELISKDFQHLSNAIALRLILTAIAMVPAIVAVQRLP